MPDPDTPAQRVLLLHGIFMPALSMFPIARTLRREGFQATLFGYAGALGGPEQALPRLRRQLRGHDAVVAHSLGGLLVLEALRTSPELPPRRVVCLGSPLGGSGAARALARRPLTAWYTGRSRELLCRGTAQWPARHKVGMVAGRVPLGLGALVADLASPHDGTVAVAETRVPGLADHVEVDASHMGLLLSAEAAAQVSAFLCQGAFTHGAPRNGSGA